jgi:Leucine-rich repeat (LRR) protein
MRWHDATPKEREQMVRAAEERWLEWEHRVQSCVGEEETARTRLDSSMAKWGPPRPNELRCGWETGCTADEPRLGSGPGCTLTGPVTDALIPRIRGQGRLREKPLKLERFITNAAVASLVKIKDDITRLEIRDSAEVSDLAPLSQLAHLESLVLSELPLVRDLAPIARLPNLKRLSLHAKRDLDISPLRGAESLETLSMSLPRLQDLSPLRGLKKLNRIHLFGVPTRDLSPLTEMPELSTLFLSNSVIDSSSLRKLAKLEALRVDISPFDLVILRSLPNLKRLSLERASIQSWESLRAAVNLERLSVRDTSFSDIKLLQGMSRLRELDISQCIVKNPIYLAALFRLEELFLDGTEGIEDPALLHAFPKLRRITLRQGTFDENAVSELRTANPHLKIHWLTAEGAPMP